MNNQDDNVYRKSLEVFSTLSKRLHILYDPVFKKYFIDNLYILEYYFSLFFPLFRVQRPVKLVCSHNEIPPKIDADLKKCGKSAVADLLGTCTWILQDGTPFDTYFNCEAQQHFSDSDNIRIFYYGTAQYHAQMKRGQLHTDMMPVATLIFANTASFAGDNGHCIQTIPQDADHWRRSNEKDPRPYTVLIVLSRVPESTLTLKAASPLENFLCFMKKSDTLNAEEFKTLWNKGDLMLRKATAKYANLFDNKEFFEEMKDLKIDLRFAQIRTEGKAEGKAEGKEELRQEIAARMLSQGLDQAIIRHTLRLTEKELAHIVEARESVEIS